MTTEKQFIDFNAKTDGEIYHITASTPDIDRDGESILPEAFKGGLSNYLANPVVLFSHDPTKPIGRADSVTINPGKSMDMNIRFGSTPLGQEVKTLYDEGILNAFSVGFLPKSAEYDNDGTYTYTECELLEVSAVSIPSNRAATMIRDAEMRGFDVTEIKKSFGVVNPEDTNDDGVPGVAPKGELEKSPYLDVASKYLSRRSK